MKKLIALLGMFAVSMAAQGPSTIISVLPYLARCGVTTPAFVMWTGNGFSCVALPAGVTLTGNVLTIPTSAPVTPRWQAETVSLASQPATATSVTYTTLKAPITGVVLWWYNSTNLFLSASGALAFAGNPIVVTLPVGWTTTDTIVISYQSQ